MDSTTEEKVKKTAELLKEFGEKHHEAIRLGTMIYTSMVADGVRDRFEKLPPNKQKELLDKLNELENEESGE